jgi:nitroreductase
MRAELQFVFRRRSVRRYTAEEVSPELVRALLEAAMAAPSACCKDPWEFIVVRSAQTRNAIAEALPNGKMLSQAPVGVVVCGDLQRAHGGELSYLLQDCSAAIENLLLAAQALGLGGCWLGVHPRPERIAHLRQLFSLPEHVLPVSVVALGWPAETPPPRTRYTATAVHQERW